MNPFSQRWVFIGQHKTRDKEICVGDHDIKLKTHISSRYTYTTKMINGFIMQAILQVKQSLIKDRAQRKQGTVMHVVCLRSGQRKLDLRFDDGIR